MFPFVFSQKFCSNGGHRSEDPTKTPLSFQPSSGMSSLSIHNTYLFLYVCSFNLLLLTIFLIITGARPPNGSKRFRNPLKIFQSRRDSGMINALNYTMLKASNTLLDTIIDPKGAYRLSEYCNNLKSDTGDALHKYYVLEILHCSLSSSLNHVRSAIIGKPFSGPDVSTS